VVNFTFEILGISGEEYEFKRVKITVYLDPNDYSEQIRLLIKIILEPTACFSKPIHIHLQNNREIKIKDDEILNKSEKIKNLKYLEGIGTDKIWKEANVLRIELPWFISIAETIGFLSGSCKKKKKWGLSSRL
jgi:hypothetical protein